jgi:glycosyltransferase involved in cell wall biosynthesis
LIIAIYSPALNEEKHAAAWAESGADADYRIVADTGSTDRTKEILQAQGVQVHDVFIKPWRFDLAYNVTMALIPAHVDVCICLHMDERLEPGWRQKLEAAWQPDTTRLRYTYVWNWMPDGSPGKTWWGDRIHARVGYSWAGATHEGLCARLPEQQHMCADLRILHYPEAKHKSNDLTLLREAVAESPNDARIRAYLGRELMYRGEHAECVKVYKEFLTMPSWNVERGHAMVNLSKVDAENVVYWLKCAALEVPTHREPHVELARYYYQHTDWRNCWMHAQKALTITTHPMDYTCSEEAWSWLPHDLAAIAAWNLGLRQEARHHAQEALKCNSTDTRLQNNLKVIEDWFRSEQLA